MRPAEFEHTIVASEWKETQALDGADPGISKSNLYCAISRETVLIVSELHSTSCSNSRYNVHLPLFRSFRGIWSGTKSCVAFHVMLHFFVGMC
jgi:hypothetical protein